MDVPTSADVRAAYPKFDWAGRGYGTVSGDDPLDDLVAEAVAYVAFITWRPIDDTMPAGLVATAKRAIVLRTVQDVLLGDDSYAETVNDDAIQSFSIGPYSETRRTPERGSRYAAAGLPALNPWETLNQLLWMLLSLVPGESNSQVDDRRNYWRSLMSGVNQPAFGLQEIDWTNQRSGLIPNGWAAPGATLDIHDPVI